MFLDGVGAGVGQGRPLGSMMLWLERGHAPGCIGRQQHKQVKLEDLPVHERRAARARLHAIDGSDVMFGLEDAASGDSEPEVVY